jgi:glycosyltransferase involved in cell wall biosynthesis
VVDGTKTQAGDARVARAPVLGRFTPGQAGWPTAAELERRRATYASLLDRAERSRRRGDLDDSLLSAYAAAQTAYLHHFGLWRDPRLEALARELGGEIARDLRPARATKPAEPGRRRIVHMASVLLDAGGHTEVIRQWTRAIHEMGIEQYLISSELQDSTVLGRGALAAVRGPATGVELYPRGLSGSERVRWLARRLLELNPDELILHIDPADVFALAAIEAARSGSTFRICFYNHCDHTFNVGSEVADRVVHFRRETVPHSVHHRALDPVRARWVPLTADPPAGPAVARAALHVPEGSTLSITAANFHKIVPDEHWNYGDTLAELLESEPQHYHLMVGDGLRRHRWYLTRALARRPRGVRSRIRWLGRRTDLSSLFGAADLMLDSAPLSGGTTKIQAMSAGLPIVATYPGANPLLALMGALDEDYRFTATSGEEAVRHARELIHDPALRAETGRRLAELYAVRFSPEVLRSRLACLFGPDDEPTLALPPAVDFDDRHLAGLSGPVASAPALLRRARVLLADPGIGAGDRVRRKVDRAVVALRGVSRS